jgi:hypothetical protein
VTADHSFTGPGVEEQDAEVRSLPLAATPLEALKTAFSRIQRRSDEIRLPHPGAKHIVFVFNRHKVTDYDLLSKWSNASEGDQMEFAVTLLANANEDIVVDGKSSGFTLASAELQQITDTLHASAAVKAFFDRNFIWIRTLAGRLSEEAGKEDDGEDPTTEPSTN